MRPSMMTLVPPLVALSIAILPGTGSAKSINFGGLPSAAANKASAPAKRVQDKMKKDKAKRSNRNLTDRAPDNRNRRN